ncbi:tyrosine-protein kinase family protein, partial [Parabacteroides distasonis]|uniref:tyrosine-protein kinase family protein n=1 Tax=Parabacteroides distasonis TaxID=823 RepID=UPI0005C7F497
FLGHSESHETILSLFQKHNDDVKQLVGISKTIATYRKYEPIPPNPTELVARDVLEKAIARLKERYDYVILDTAPIGMVTDTAIIGRVADMCVYVCRADVTPKAGFSYINVLRRERKFPKLATVINGLDMTKRKNSYGYGYGKKYGYGKGYGYGYGYGYGFEAGDKKK